ncbi:PHP domain-containing protein [Kocuria carniphila]|uniref:PHP domain-containing protein n=1 Tax=Kocuria carniphila TaxID=262208 RepID=UPI0021A684EE|nr:PHP domain-containing protein [Kocuria carniphila]MCT1801565.1 PHP domain-containing protein [Kocuria carniphila]
MRIDLHTHSIASDGTETPADVARSAKAAGLDVFALTDHDTTAGWQEAGDTAVELGLAFVPGMEITCTTSNGVSVHMLSYLHDPTYEPLWNAVESSRSGRLSRAKRMVELLSADYDISWDDVLRHVGTDATVGRPHIADALVELGIISNRSAAFSDILSGRSPYYVRHTTMDPVKAIKLVRAAGGVPVCAHPMAPTRGRIPTTADFNAMIDAGLAGLEVAHRDNPDETRAILMQMAADHDLIVTGSSDYHGKGKPNLLGENSTSVQSLTRISEEATSSVEVRWP